METELASRADQSVLSWFAACGQSEGVSYGQKGVACGRKWRAGTRETEVRLYIWCEGGLGQQRNDGGGCASMRKRVESISTCVTEWVSRCHFAWPYVLSDRPPVLWGLSPGESWDAVTWSGWDKLWKWRNYWISSIWAKGCMLMIVCVLSDLTWPPLLGGWRKSWYIITVILRSKTNHIFLHYCLV